MTREALNIHYIDKQTDVIAKLFEENNRLNRLTDQLFGHIQSLRTSLVSLTGTVHALDGLCDRVDLVEMRMGAEKVAA